MFAGLHIRWRQEKKVCFGTRVTEWNKSRDVCFSTNLKQSQPSLIRAFIHTWHRLHVFPRLVADLAPDDVFPRLAPMAFFVNRLRYLAFVWDAVSFAFSSVKTERFLLLNCKHSVLEKLYGLSCFPQLLVLFLVVVIAFIWICIKNWGRDDSCF